MSKEIILIAGGTGLIGLHLCPFLEKKGYNVRLLSRYKTSKPNHFYWNPQKEEIDSEALNGVNYVINLSGAGIADRRWTPKRKQFIIDSRVKSGDFLLKKIQENYIQIQSYISASAVGYYGAVTTDHIFKETDQPASDFLGICCKKWEESAKRFEQNSIRTVIVRTPIVLTPKGGALSKMKFLARLGLAAALGNGKQFIPWIHIQDLCNCYLTAISNEEINGVYNVAAPQHITNHELNKNLSSVLNKPFCLPNIPAPFLRIIFGEMAVLFLKGSRVSSEKLISTGFEFEFPEIQMALNNL